MIQFNLLPDVKLEYIRSRRTKRLVMLAASLVAAGTLTIFVFLFMVVQVLQKQHTDHLTKDIKENTKKLQGIQDLDKILTVQSQLATLPDLHKQKPATSRLFDYLAQLTPAQVTITNLKLTFEGTTLIVEGQAASLIAVNQYVDTLKFAKYTSSNAPGEQKSPFSDVVLSKFDRDENEAKYEITMQFDGVIFDNTQTITMVVPKDRPNPLFVQEPQEPNPSGTGN